MPRLKTVATTAALLAFAAGVVWQQLRIKRLMAEAAVLHEQGVQASAVREKNERLAGQLKAALGREEAERSELLRLRGQFARLRQAELENTRLIAERDRLAKAPRPAAAETQEADEPQTPEAKLRRAKGFFARDLGLALRFIAQANDGNLPAELRGPVFDVLEAIAPSNQEFNFRVKDFELVYDGSLREVKNVSETILAREKEPMQLADGRWVRVYVLADGSSQHIGAATKDGFAAREQEFWPGQRRIVRP
ncbi:MAG TPA: hypothetical protein VFT34_16635 [Verrucomicrobiae bacterium]|nr:hypothetical protein [Verrucomicrobiae bacterium]